MTKRIDIQLPEQTLMLSNDGVVISRYAISSAKNGAGEHFGSECTPRGRHIIRAMIGRDAEPGSVFVGRRPTGEIYNERLGVQHLERDWILSRILWLSGTEKAFNRLGDVDTMRRYIYIHGCPDTFNMGEPASHGCIRMNNTDVVNLFNQVVVGTVVQIHDR